ncbi:unnamed protein product [Didymodactylos carnosus]|uniref:Tetratricopeptide repeat protein n=1 Tax=Didymodactylos carnosus TaxID=1234261 RepID=A0A8S2QKS0_9BILA|nr:unnamed protein product [Didymodactylos carnosus]CAF4112140.1 unnamed protein product [Didymodactylos carnosus]
MLNECRLYYKDDVTEQQKIDDFETNYSAKNAIRWYTRDCFVYRLLNKAFRTQNIEIIFKFRFFLTDLYNQLNELYHEYTSMLSSIDYTILTLYRGQHLSIDEFKKVENNIGGKLSMNTFLSTTIDKYVALVYAGNGSKRPLNESVLFEMTIDTTVITEKRFADIGGHSYFESENEILISFGSVYRIDSVEEINGGPVWIVKLTFISEENERFCNLLPIATTTDDFHETPNLIFIGNILVEMEQYQKAERFYKMVLNELLPNDSNILEVYNNLAIVYMGYGDTVTALSMAEKALEWIEKYTSSQSKQATNLLTMTYLYLGTIHSENNNHDTALGYYRKCLTYPQDNKSVLSSIYDGIAGEYRHLENLDLALKNQQKCFELACEIFPENHPNIGQYHINLGYIYLKHGDHNDLGFEHLQKGQKIIEEYYPITHPQLALTYYNLGFIYGLLYNINLAYDYFAKALDYGLKSLNSDHPRIKLYRESVSTAKRLLIMTNFEMMYYIKINHPELAADFGEDALEKASLMPTQTTMQDLSNIIHINPDHE